MKQRNFILTDVMKTGNHLSYEDYISHNTLPGQVFDMTGEYYTLHNYDLKSYARRFAIIDIRIENARVNCEEFRKEFESRMEKLQKNNFVFVYASPWESAENLKRNFDEYFPKCQFPGHSWLGGVSWFWFYMFNKHKNVNFDINHDHKKLDFLYLNKNPRKHRIELFQSLKKTDLLNNSISSFVSHPTDPFELDKKYELPWLDPKKAYPLYGMDQDLFNKPYNHTAASIISESNDNDTEIFITEKLWKAVIMKHIFVVHGNYNYLKKLQELGFKTFNNFIDESYDTEKNKHSKIKKLILSLRQLKNKDYKKLYEETESIRTHNQKYFFNKEALGKTIDAEILLWLKFFDGSEISSTKS